MLLILSAYITYVINAAQFVLKLRAARLQEARMKEMNNKENATHPCAIETSQGYPA